MKKSISGILLALVLLFTTACNKAEEVPANSIKFVKAQAIESDEITTGYNYIGIVKAKETKNYAFLSGGKIAKINVEKGGSFKKGDILASLDSTALEYSADIGQNNKKQADSALEKAIATYDTNIENTKSQIATLENAITAGEQGISALEEGLKAEKINIEANEDALATAEVQLDSARELYNAGILPKNDMDNAESNFKVKEAELEAAKAKHSGNIATLESKKAELQATKAKKNEAEASLQNLYTSKEKDIATAKSVASNADISNELTTKNINDTVIQADSDGYVMELPFKEGEIISAGYPIVVAKSSDLIVTVGASDKEYKDIKIGSRAIINNTDSGIVTSIAQYPDEESRTYAVDIAVSEAYTIGESVEVRIITGTATGLYIPIDAIFNIDGVDYIYTVDADNRIHKKQIIINGFNTDKAEIQIDDTDVMVVVEGIKGLHENDIVKAEE